MSAHQFKDCDWVIAKRYDRINGRDMDVYVIGQVLINVPYTPYMPDNVYEIIPMVYFDMDYNIISEVRVSYFSLIDFKMFEKKNVWPLFRPTVKDLMAAKKRIQRSAIIRTLHMLPEEIAANVADYIV